jgi:hypothetical protein
MWHTEDGGPSYDRILEQFSALCGDVAYKVPHKISSPTQPLLLQLIMKIYQSMTILVHHCCKLLSRTLSSSI